MVVILVFPLLLLLLAVLAQLAGRGVIGKNRVVGIRIPSTLRSDAAWTAGHRAATGWSWIGFAVSTAASIAALLVSGVAQGVLGTIVVVVFIATLVLSLVSAGRAARAAQPRARRPRR